MPICQFCRWRLIDGLCGCTPAMDWGGRIDALLMMARAADEINVALPSDRPLRGAEVIIRGAVTMFDSLYPGWRDWRVEGTFRSS